MAACSHCARPLGKRYYRAEALRFHPECYRCAHCQQSLSESFQLKKGKLYHPACYPQANQQQCAHCREALSNTWMVHERKKYHEHCYQSHYQPRCVICQQAISDRYHTDAQGAYHVACFEQHRLQPCAICQAPLKGKYLQDSWGHQACTQHGGRKTQQCHVCARLIGQATSQGGVQYGDGRIVCGLCRMSEVTTPAQIEQSRQRVLQALHAVGFDYIPNYIAVSLGDKQTLNRSLGRGGNCHGFTKTIERTVNGQKHSEHSIFILYGLPRLMFEGVLAHELIHVWLNERQLNHHAPREIEGFCNLGTAWIYQEDATPLANVLLERMQKSADPVYGEGYRRQLKRVQSQGWVATIAAMQQGPGAVSRFLKFTDRWI